MKNATNEKNQKISSKILDKNIIKKNFSKVAKNYQNNAIVQKIAAKKLTDHFADFILPKSSIIDLGSATGTIAKLLNKNHSEKNFLIYQSDLSEEMLSQNYQKDQQRFCLDITEIDKINKKFDAIISSFSLQWIDNHQEFLVKARKILNQKGILAIAIPTAESLVELRKSSVASGCDFDFVDLPEFNSFRKIIEESGFEQKFLTKEIEIITFKNALEALKNIKKFGGNYHDSSKKNPQTGKKNITKKQLAEFNNFCSKNYSAINTKNQNLSANNSIYKNDSNISITWEIGYFIYQKSINI